MSDIGGLNWKFIFSLFWKLEASNPGTGKSGSGGGTTVVQTAPFLLCLHRAGRGIKIEKQREKKGSSLVPPL